MDLVILRAGGGQDFPLAAGILQPLQFAIGFAKIPPRFGRLRHGRQGGFEREHGAVFLSEADPGLAETKIGQAVMGTTSEFGLQFRNGRLDVAHLPKYISDKKTKTGAIWFELKCDAVFRQSLGKAAHSLLPGAGEFLERGGLGSSFAQGGKTQFGKGAEQLSRLKLDLRRGVSRQGLPDFCEGFREALLGDEVLSLGQMQWGREAFGLGRTANTRQAKQEEPSISNRKKHDA